MASKANIKSQASINNAVGNWIFFRLTNFPRELVGSTSGIYDPDGWIKAKLRGVDQFGIWLENPHFKITYLVDGKGNPMRPDQQDAVTETVFLLIKWQFIASILRVESDEADQERPAFGFPGLGQQPTSLTSKESY